MNGPRQDGTPRRVTPKRYFRLGDADWVAFVTACERRGLTASEVLRAYVRRYPRQR